ncbi:hypothetical protein EOD41_17955 [Mucilaginibacter limnophilus]|uniref:Uncharacterized protein n=1 Tax=Mucilaginibacter limnophilus TaxID=1932778 RepID=A0A3S2UK03_9SPHI|nr:hypothetical protein [Mucilaginibacter limnophilus]RVT98254.1 hypothetical protein EOD41_17955 [Mucilaginibacter limnophilus]
MQTLAEKPAAATADCTNLINADTNKNEEVSLLNQFTEDSLAIAITEDAGHKNNLSGALSFLPPKQKNARAEAESILAYYETDDLFQYDDAMHAHAVCLLRQRIEQFNNHEDFEDSTPSYYQQILIVWLLAALLPAYLVLLFVGVVEFYSTATLCFTGVYLALTGLLIALNIER